MHFNNGNISVLIDDNTGITTEITNPNDEHLMNWIIENSNWGTIDGFMIQKVDAHDNKVCILCSRDKLQVEIKRKLLSTVILKHTR